MKSNFLPEVRLLRRFLLSATVVVAALSQASAQPQQPPQAQQSQADSRPVRVYIRAGLKTHAVGEHDYPQFLADWSKILTDRGAIVDGSLHFPTADELANVDVMVTYKGDAGYMTAEEKSTLEVFLRRGGGLVALHDTICAEDPVWFSSVYGGAKKHGETNFTLSAPVAFTIKDTAHPIMKNMTNFTITDESFYAMTWADGPGLNVLAEAPQAGATAARAGVEGQVVPQIWTYEPRAKLGAQPYRAFVFMQGHNYANFAHEQVQPMLLRAIAWAAKAPVDSLLEVRATGRGRGGPGAAGGRGGRGGRGRGAPGAAATDVVIPGTP